MKKILVAGAAGFIGSNLCQRLLENNLVIGLDNFASSNGRNLERLKKSSHFSFIQADICLLPKIDQTLDEIYDLACPASPVDFVKMPIEILMTNAIGVKNLLDLAQKNKAKFLHTSTSEIYGDPLVHPQKETYWGNVNPIGPRSCYDEGKRFAESLIVNYRQKYQLQAKIVRVFNTYGPGMRPDDGRVVSNFICQAIKGEDLAVYGEGGQTRSFCYVDDLVDGLVKMMMSDEIGPINLGNPKEFTILELAQLISRLMGNRSKIIFKPLPADDPKQRQPNISLAKEKLDWKPEISLDKGIKTTIEYFKKIL